MPLLDPCHSLQLSARARNSLAALDKALDKLDKELKEMEQDPRRFRL